MGPDWKQKQGFQIPGVRVVHTTVAPDTPAYLHSGAVAQPRGRSLRPIQDESSTCMMSGDLNARLRA
jgi:hypothetical protein